MKTRKQKNGFVQRENRICLQLYIGMMKKMQHHHTTSIFNPPLFLANSPELGFIL